VSSAGVNERFWITRRHLENIRVGRVIGNRSEIDNNGKFTKNSSSIKDHSGGTFRPSSP
jgi:hypothetical protein